MKTFKTANNGKTFESFLNDMNVTIEIVGENVQEYYNMYIEENDVTMEKICYGIF